ncbi:MAG: 3-keto-disaccharide hydrolase [Thermoguttaceae bacterium]
MKRTVLAALVVFSSVIYSYANDKALTEAEKADGWVSIFNGENLDGWKSNEGDVEGFYVKDGCIFGKGGRNHLFFMEELGDFELKIDCKISKGGNSGLYFHAPWTEKNWPVEGFELQINSSHSDPVKTGSLYNILKIFKAPHGDDEWFTYYITVKGDTLTVRINDEVLYTYVDPVEKSNNEQRKQEDGDKKSTPKITEATKTIRQKGHIALQQHDPESIPQFKNVFLKKM